MYKLNSVYSEAINTFLDSLSVNSVMGVKSPSIAEKGLEKKLNKN